MPVNLVAEEATVCCAPLASGALTESEADVLAGRLKALADPVRLRLLSLIMASPDGEGCTCDLVAPVGLSQPTVTHHLRRLAEVGIVTGEKRGRWTFYRVESGALDAVVRALRP